MTGPGGMEERNTHESTEEEGREVKKERRCLKEGREEGSQVMDYRGGQSQVHYMEMGMRGRARQWKYI